MSVVRKTVNFRFAGLRHSEFRNLLHRIEQAMTTLFPMWKSGDLAVAKCWNECLIGRTNCSCSWKATATLPLSVTTKSGLVTSHFLWTWLLI